MSEAWGEKAAGVSTCGIQGAEEWALRIPEEVSVEDKRKLRD